MNGTDTAPTPTAKQNAWGIDIGSQAALATGGKKSANTNWTTGFSGYQAKFNDDGALILSHAGFGDETQHIKAIDADLAAGGEGVAWAVMPDVSTLTGMAVPKPLDDDCLSGFKQAYPTGQLFKVNYHDSDECTAALAEAQAHYDDIKETEGAGKNLGAAYCALLQTKMAVLQLTPVGDNGDINII